MLLTLTASMFFLKTSVTFSCMSASILSPSGFLMVNPLLREDWYPCLNLEAPVRSVSPEVRRRNVSSRLDDHRSTLN